MPARPFDEEHKGTSEFGGAVGPAGVAPKGRETLTASEKLRLGYLTGTEDPEAPIDARWFQGEDPAKWDALKTQFPLPENTLTWVDENFKKADGALGPLRTWSRYVFSHQFPFRVSGEKGELFADAPGSWEDIWAPDVNVSSPNVEIKVRVVDLVRGLGTGAPEYTIDVGAVARAVTREEGSNYRAYTAGVGRNNIFIPPGHTWHMAIFRVDGLGTGGQVLLPGAITLLPLASVALPGVFTFTVKDHNLTARFDHSGGGGPMVINAVDQTYADGFPALGGSVAIAAGDTGSIKIDSFTVRAI